ncbi:MAG: dTDP-glucose 4,6-dehydratase [Lentisphaerae bacterium ADurb.Bin242]|nr:MAG: dTDP-glucose 4,6-dehydratase [Lentisphaerae bacterium ADurb.Bin242]
MKMQYSASNENRKSSFEGERIFLTGGTGFFGKSILSMLQRGFSPETEWVVLSRDPKGFLQSNPEFSGLEKISFLSGDVRDFSFPEMHFDGVLHCAAPTHGVPDGEVRDIILKGTRHVLDFAEKCGARRVLMASSGAVYGIQPSELERILEDFPCSPVTEYGIAKLEAEQMCLASGVPTVIARCFAFTGPYLDRNVHFAIGNFIRDCLEGKDIVIQGDGTSYRSYLYADDLVEWLCAILSDGKDGRVYNVGSDQAVSILELAETIRRAIGSDSRIRIRESPSPGRQTSRYVPDISRATSELGLSVKVSLEDAIQKSSMEPGRRS